MSETNLLMQIRSMTALIGRTLIGALTVSFAAVLFAGLTIPARAQTSASAENLWGDAFAAFSAADLQHAPPPGGVLFVGSSSIRLWDHLETDFHDAPVIIKRGFGGSRLTDCVKFLDRLVVQYHPRQVLLYAGDNDLAEGSTPEQILDRMKAFTEGVHKWLPRTKVTFISIKPSPARRALIPRVRAANALVRQYALEYGGIDYIDVFTPMLAADGSPRRELFREDALHLNSAGYALWRAIIQPYLEERVAGSFALAH
jgi:lysophospholipase L1-like esterase